MTKTKLTLGVTTALVAFAAATVAPEAAAHTAKKAHKHAKKAATYQTTETHSSSFSHSNSSNAKVDALESQLQAMQSEIRNLRAAQGRPTIDPDTAKVQELDQWMNSVKHEGHAGKGAKDNMVFFRGGYSRATNGARGGLSPVVDGGLLDGGIGANGDPLVGSAVDSDAWYFGAGFDFSLNDNLFGMMHGTEVLAELLVDYKEYADRTFSAVTGQNVTTNQLTLAASPKIKFLKGSNFRPWLIPAGFEVNVISPPSGAVTVLNPGMMFGAGADYKIWNNIYAGADVRYHYSADDVDGVDTDGITAGGYIGLGF
jgi:type II secretory pathway pseudopilin PulG